MKIWQTLLLVIISLSAAYSQKNSLHLTGGYSFSSYQFQKGNGYNVNVGYEHQFKSKKLVLGAQLVLSNTYGIRYTALIITNHDVAAQVGGNGLHYIEFPDGVDDTYPVDNSTYLALKERGYLKHYKPNESYHHTFYLDVYTSFNFMKRKKIIWDFTSGIGIGIANTSEALAGYEQSYLFKNAEGKHLRIRYVVDRKTKHLYWSVNFTTSLVYQLNSRVGLVLKETFHITPKMFVYGDFLDATLFLTNIGFKVNIDD